MINSNKYFRVFEYFDQAVVISDIKGKVFYFNKKGEELFGYTAEELIGNNMYEMIPALNLEKREISEIRKMHEAGESYSSEYKVTTKSGKEIIIYATVSPIFDEEGKIEGLIGISRDITAKKKEEELLHLLNESNKDLSADLNWVKMLDNICNLIVPKFADYFSLFLYNEYKNDLEVTLIRHKDPELNKLTAKYVYLNPPSIKNDYGSALVFKTKEISLLQNISEETLEAIAQDKERLEILKKIGFRSALVMPMIVKDKCIGVLSLAATRDSNIEFTQDDIKILTELVNRIALHIENGKLYQYSNKELERRKRAEQALTEMMEALPLLAWTNNDEGEVDFFNKSWYEYTGLSPEDSYGYGWSRAIHPEQGESSVAEWNEFVKSGKDLFETKLRIRNKFGEYRWFLTRAVPLLSEDNKIKKWLGTSTYIDDQVNEERKKDEFLSIASHEIKTPLSSAKAYLDYVLMLDGEYSDNTALYLNKVRQQLNVLHKLVVDFLELSRIQTGKVEYRQNEIDIDELISNSIQNFSYLNHKNLRYSGRINKFISGDRDRLEQVMNNLLSNAVKYSSPEHEIYIYTKDMDDRIQIIVEDNGKGINKNHLNHIFDKFYKVDDKENVTGMGIGLYITREIINHHKGKIWAESEEGKGTKFYIELPGLNN